MSLAQPLLHGMAALIDQDLSTDLADYTKFGLMLGSAVSSTGNLEKSVNTYPILQILGVGGMGCVFLCENYNPLIDNKNIVVKCFGETLTGSGKKVFKEAIAMRKIAGNYVYSTHSQTKLS